MALRGIDHAGDEAPDTIGPRAVGALPFEGGGRMVVPARVVTRDASGAIWRTTIESAERPAIPVAPGVRSPSRYIVEQRTSPDEWEASVVGALARIDAGAAEKIVLAREIAIEADAPFDLRAVI